jgi:polyphosphate kinase 2 (PPK2 family)
VRPGTILLKYWLSLGAEEQELRFQERAKNPDVRWKLSDMNIKSRGMSVEYFKAKDEAFLYTDIPEAPGTRSRPMTSAGRGSMASATSSTRSLTSM